MKVDFNHALQVLCVAALFVLEIFKNLALAAIMNLPKQLLTSVKFYCFELWLLLEAKTFKVAVLCLPLSDKIRFYQFVTLSAATQTQAFNFFA